MAIVAAIAAMVFVIACGSDEPEPAPAVDPGQADPGRSRQCTERERSRDSEVGRGCHAGQPQGASAAEIQNLVSDSVTAAIGRSPRV